jgi:ABC-type nitrate/sulfonate/bicarbonate transport system ATPase subunit
MGNHVKAWRVLDGKDIHEYKLKLNLLLFQAPLFFPWESIHENIANTLHECRAKFMRGGVIWQVQ